MSTPYDPPAHMQESITELERQLAEERAERANFKHAIAGSLHVSGASEDTLVDFVARLYARAAESEAGAARMREALQWFRDRSHCQISPMETEQRIDEALSSTTGADLLREVTALRELEEVARRKFVMGPDEERQIRCTLGNSLDGERAINALRDALRIVKRALMPALDAVDAVREKP